jgi:uncharacterized membrane protein
VTGPESHPGGGKSFGTLLSELVALVVAYVKQETIIPIKALGRFVVRGVAGAVLLGIGGAMLTLAAVRAVQSETGSHLRGNLSWVPYMGGVLIAGIGAGWAVSRIAKGPAQKRPAR